MENHTTLGNRRSKFWKVVSKLGRAIQDLQGPQEMSLSSGIYRGSPTQKNHKWKVFKEILSNHMGKIKNDFINNTEVGFMYISPSSLKQNKTKQKGS